MYTDPLSSSEEEIEDVEHTEDLIALARRNMKIARGDNVDDEEVEKGGETTDRDFIYNSAALKQKLADIQYSIPAGYKRVPWIESLVIEVVKDEKLKVGQDVMREATFHNSTMDGVKEAYRRLHVMGVPASRPNDYYAEMFKSDKQMFKVRSRIAYEQKAIDIVDTRRKNKSEKKFAKQVQHERIQEKNKDRAAAKEKVDRLKAKGKLDVDALDEKDENSDKKKVNWRRQQKDAKYGFGGKKNKRNDAASLAQYDDAAERRGKGRGKGKGKGKGGKGAGKGGKGAGKGGKKGVKKMGKK